MSAHPRHARRLARLLALPPLVAALACADAGPAAPEAVRAPAGAPLAASYPGTTNTEFTGVQVQSEAMGLSIKFNYTGVVTPAFTVGTGPDVLATQVISVPAKKQAGGYWTAHAGGLEAGKVYWYRLDNLKSTWYDSAKTLRRDITLDLDSAYVHYDGDPGPGCGEIYIRPQLFGWVMLDKYNKDHTAWKPVLPEHCMHSGSWYRFGNSLGAKQTYAGYAPPELNLYFLVHELDIPGYCGNWTDACGQQNTTLGESNAWDVRPAGTHKFKQSTWWGYYGPHLTLFGSVTVKYAAW
jgi:hypothetical protein